MRAYVIQKLCTVKYVIYLLFLEVFKLGEVWIDLSGEFVRFFDFFVEHFGCCADFGVECAEEAQHLCKFAFEFAAAAVKEACESDVVFHLLFDGYGKVFLVAVDRK